uniref:DUF659 domain-containing protein n=1 Tax=Timema douglasi TaxID=61478 RepID=A0A7R8VKE6_TIMDO|nr:unnamed protein product [Timema douglasi]
MPGGQGDIFLATHKKSVDETTDRCGRCIANIVDSTEPSSPHLIASRVLEVANSSTIARAVHDSLRVLWPSENNDEKFMVLLTYSAAYMLKAGASLKVFYPKLIHVTCLAHTVHRVAEHIRAQFPNINAVISSVKKVFLKVPSHIAKFREKLPKTPLPQQTVLTQWDTWLQAAVYYADHMYKIQRIIQTFDEEDSVTVVSDLAYVKSYFGNLPGVIVSLEARDLPLIESVKIMHTIQEGVKQTPGPVASSVATKLEQVLQRNPGWRTMVAVSDILGGQSTPLQEISLNSSELVLPPLKGLHPIRVRLLKERPDGVPSITTTVVEAIKHHERPRRLHQVKPLAITSMFKTLFPLDEVDAKRVIDSMSVTALHPMSS